MFPNENEKMNKVLNSIYEIITLIMGESINNILFNEPYMETQRFSTNSIQLEVFSSFVFPQRNII